MPQADPYATSGPASFNRPDPAPTPFRPADPAAQSGPASFASENPVAAVDRPENNLPGLPSAHTRPDLNRRVYQLLLQGHNWMGLQTLYGLADSGMSDEEVTHTANYLRRITVQGVQANALRQQYQQGRSTVNSQKQGQADVDQELSAHLHPGVGALGTVDVGPTAAQTATHEQLLNKAKEFINQADDGFKHLWDDPVLQKHPSGMLTIQRYLSGVLGTSPVAGGSLTHMQKQMQLMGYGRDLEANGVMSAGWSGAIAGYKQGVYEKQLKGDRPGSITVDHAIRALQALTPTNAWNALLGVVLHLPDGARQLISDVAGSYAGLTAGIVQSASQGNLDFITKKQGTSWQREAHGGVAAGITKYLGGEDTSPEANVKDFQENFGKHFLEDGINVLMLSSMLGSGSRFFDAAGVERAASMNPEVAGALSKDAALSGSGVVAKSLTASKGLEGIPGMGTTSAVVSRGLLGAAVGGGGAALAGGTPAQIFGGALLGGTVGGMTATNAFNNIPILNRISPVINNLADSEGSYYKIREFVHSPYTWTSPANGAIKGAIGSATRLGDTAFNQSLLLGAEAQGLAQAQQTLTGEHPGPNSFASSVQNTHTIDQVNDAIKHNLDFTALGVHIQPSIDYLQFAFGGRGAAALKASPSSSLGEQMSTLMGGVSTSIRETGIGGDLERLYGKKLRYIARSIGGEQNLASYFMPKVMEHAANLAATVQYDKGLQGLGEVSTQMTALSNEKRLMGIRDIEHTIMADPKLQASALKDMLAQGHGDQLFARLQADKANNPMQWEPAFIRQQLEANRFAHENLLPYLDDHLIPGVVDRNHVGVVPNGKGTLGSAPIKGVMDTDEAHNLHVDLQGRLDGQIATTKAAGTPEEGAVAVAGVDPKEIAQWNKELNDHLRNDFAVDHSAMPQVEPQERLDIAKKFAENHLPIRLKAHPDAPVEVQQKLDELDRMGFKLVDAKDPSHSIAYASAPWDKITGGLTYRRRLAEVLGLNPDHINDAAPGASADVARMLAVKEYGDKGGNLGGWSPQAIIGYLQQAGVLPGRATLAGRAEDMIGRREKLAKVLGVEADELPAEVVPLMDAHRKEIVEALTDMTKMEKYRPAQAQEFHEQLALRNDELAKQGLPIIDPDQMGIFSRKDAEGIYAAIRKGSSQVPAFQIGANKLETLARNEFGFAGVIAKHVDNSFGWALANVPNRLIQVRNEFRFDLSPWLDIRRIVKTNVKMAAFKVPSSVRPIEQLVKDGVWDEAKLALNEAQPTKFTAEALGYADDANRYIRSEGIMGYNMHGFQAWAAYHMKKDGLSPEQISTNLDKIFTYGNRTGVERSLNFVFFPFSFEKSLYKVMGTYILDQPAQRLLLTNAVMAYNEFNKMHEDGTNPLATSFWKKHVPLMEEVNGVNAFTRGINAGEAGGLNRPMMNLFLPQSWSPSSDNYDLARRFVPVVNDFKRIWAETVDQANIAVATEKRLWRKVVDNDSGSFADPLPSTLAENEQLEKGFEMQLELNKFYHKNIINGDMTPISPEWGQFAHRRMTKQLIREIVHKAYPAYDAEGAATYVISANAKFDAYKDSLRGTPGKDGKFHDPKKFPNGEPMFPYMEKFQSAANDLGAQLSNSDNPAALKGVTDNLRKAAMYLAEHDPEFYALYKTTFGRMLGPLERPENQQ